MQKVKFLWVSSGLGNLLVLPHQALPASSQHYPGSLSEGGLAWGQAEGSAFPKVTAAFASPRSILCGCRGHLPLCQELDFRVTEW